ncbi:hypothetical protein ALI22I_09430 [Saccharothrix sp. ALI-22-I]|uniref:hypothetical protein n=1 Tax=Saccharothrix sp. ALI-22-I TaxID=1933778 RepID=UPI00097C753F|nr:hypothetical protein [Saccharothrix sp. ALI-22-I]ONI91281.1 hypothetical protein ALI22I_09430 [Saccharothrix sp. ALI-22-I]
MKPDITFSAEGIDTETRGAVRTALADIGDWPAPGGWPMSVQQIDVCGVLNGGRSGAVVLEARVRSLGRWLRHVVKVDHAEKLAQEWNAFNEHVLPTGNAQYSPIVAYSSLVASPSHHEVRPLAALVYRHVADHLGGGGQQCTSLGEGVRRAVFGDQDVEPVVRLIGRLFDGLRLLHDVPTGDSGVTLRALNVDLGPSLTLEVDRVQGPDLSYHGTGVARDAFVTGLDVIEFANNHKEELLGQGRLVVLLRLKVKEVEPELVLRGDDFTVLIRSTLRFGFAVGEEVNVRGKVVSVRGVDRLELLREAFGPALTESDDHWSVDGLSMASPFAALLPALTAQRDTRPRKVVHGDLNADNVLLAGDGVSVIDYDRTSPGLLETDFAWLEVNLVRNVLAGLGFEAVLRLQRAAALASALMSECGGDEAERCALPLLDGTRAESAAFRVLFAVRRKLFDRHREQERVRWWRDYLDVLLIAAHRSLRWTGPVQTPDKLRVSAAIAGVAGEWLNDDVSPFENWPDADIAVARSAMKEQPHFGSDQTVHLAAQLFGAGVSPCDARELGRQVLAGRVSRTEWLRRLISGDSGCRVERRVVTDQPGARGSRPLPAVSTLVDEQRVFLTGAQPGEAARVADQVVRRLAADALAGSGHRLPLMVAAGDLVRSLGASPSVTGPLEASAGAPWVAIAGQAATLGTFHLVITDWGQDEPEARAVLDRWLGEVEQEFPAMAILLCSSSPCQPPSGFRAYRLVPLDVETVRKMVLSRLDLHAESERDAVLELAVLSNISWEHVDLKEPAVLDLLLRHVDATWKLPVHPGVVFARTYYRGLSALDRVNAEKIAELLTDNGVAELPVEVVPVPTGELERLREAGVLRCERSLVAFVDPVARVLHAASALVRQLADGRSSPAKHWSRWDGPLGVLPALEATTDNTVVLLASALLPEHPVQAAGVLSGAKSMHRGIVERVVTDASTWVRSDDSGRAAVGVRVLAALGEVGRLVDVAGDDGVAEGTRAAALDAVLEVGRDYRQLNDLVSRLIEEVTGTALTVATLRAVAQAYLPVLAQDVAAQIVPGQKWSVVRQAVSTIADLGRHLGPERTAVYLSACADRLRTVAAALDGPVNPDVASTLADERTALLSTLAEAGEVRALLSMRFAFDIGVEVGRMIDRMRSADGDDPVRTLLNGSRLPTEWLDQVNTAEPEVAFAAAHRLLGEAPEVASALFSYVGPAAPRHRLLIAAGASRYDLDAAEKLLYGVAAEADAGKVECLAALVAGISAADSERGVRAAWRVARTLVLRDLPERHCRPWVTALATWRGTPAQWDAMLCVEEDVTSAVEALSTARFTLDAAPRPDHDYSARARRNLLAAMPVAEAAPAEVVRWIAAAATAGLTEALPVVRRLVAELILDETAVWRSSARDGVRRQHIAEETFAALGYLARLRYDCDPGDPEVDQVHRVLCDLRQEGAVHGRAIGLAYLGDAGPLLDAMPLPDRLRSAPVNALRLWTPGPYRPTGSRPGESIESWLIRRVGETGAVHFLELLVAVRRCRE